MAEMPCMGCGSRYPGCHAGCGCYRAAAEAAAREKAEKDKAAGKKRMVDDYELANIKRCRKRVHK